MAAMRVVVTIILLAIATCSYAQSYPFSTGPIPSSATMGTAVFGASVANVVMPFGNIVVEVIGTHALVEDLEFVLLSPSGTRVVMLAHRCPGTSDFNMEFVDSGVPTASMTCPMTVGEAVAPDSPFSAFAGENPDGVWELIIDDVASSNAGALTNATLVFVVPASPTPTNTASPSRTAPSASASPSSSPSAGTSPSAPPSASVSPSESPSVSAGAAISASYVPSASHSGTPSAIGTPAPSLLAVVMEPDSRPDADRSVSPKAGRVSEERSADQGWSTWIIVMAVMGAMAATAATALTAVSMTRPGVPLLGT